MQEISAESFASIDEKIVACASQLTDSGNWMDISKARSLYNELRVLNSKAVIISLCQQVAARPHIQIKTILLAIKLGIQDLRMNSLEFFFSMVIKLWLKTT